MQATLIMIFKKENRFQNKKREMRNVEHASLRTYLYS